MVFKTSISQKDLALVLIFFFAASCGANNPCSIENIVQGRLYHGDPSNPNKYVQCDVWGNSYQRYCPSSQVWDSLQSTCVLHGPQNDRNENLVQVDDAENVLEEEELIDVTPNEPGTPLLDANSQLLYRPFPFLYNLLVNAARQQQETTTTTPAPSQTNGGQTPWSRWNWMKRPAANGKSPVAGCKRHGVRYLEVEGDLNKYVECIQGYPILRRCQLNEVWVHPLRECVKLDAMNELPQVTTTPSEEDKKPNTRNPCALSDLRFHPYPNSPSKYIECQTWHSIFVWNCGDDQIWIQQKQTCIDKSELTPSQPDAKETKGLIGINGIIGTNGLIDTNGLSGFPEVPTPQFFENPCFQSTSKHHPYPWDKTRFIQCDEYGNMYIRRCGPNKAWDDFYKTCVGQNGLMKPLDGSGEAEQHYVQGPCPSGYYLDDVTEICTMLPVDTSLLDDLTKPVDCALGSIYDDVSGQCIITGDGNSFLKHQAEKQCAVDEFWHPIMKFCFSFPDSLLGTDDTLNKGDGDLPLKPDDVLNGAMDMKHLENPCGTQSNLFYYPYLDNPSYFIQCDQMGAMYVQPCDVGHVWNQEVMTCVPDTAGAASGKDEDDNPCADSPLTYHPHPGDKNQFIMCVYGVPYPMHCPPGSSWTKQVDACTFQPFPARVRSI